MLKERTKSKLIRTFILDHIPDHPNDIVQLACISFDISRQAVNRHMKKLEESGLIVATGSTRQRSYRLKPILKKEFTYSLEALQEYKVWADDLRGCLAELPDNVMDIWHYGVTEMINNAIDHSGGKLVSVTISKDAVNTEIIISDDGVGIFRKIKNECHLDDERHAILELAKGKLTTDPEHHTGEGIFFSSRMFDKYVIVSGTVYFSHEIDDKKDWILETDDKHDGTYVFMNLKNNSKRTDTEVFNKFKLDDEEYGFTKTVVPVKLIKHGQEKLISRSQAKRLMARIDRFKAVVLDFREVDAIGQAFADEIFRVFVNNNKETKVYYAHANKDIQNMIKRVKENVDENQLKLI